MTWCIARFTGVSSRGTLLIVAVLFSMDAKAADEQTDLKKLQGEWVVVSAKTDHPTVEPMMVGRVFKFEGNTWQSYNRSGQSEGVYTFTLRPKEDPREIDLKITKNGKRILILGIYAFDKDKLILSCSSNRDRSIRPKDFIQAGGDDAIRIFVLTRKKKK
jgi:uncharacterized protein (TIGR03067 family)